ncbi:MULTISPECIES: type VI secretion system tip protein TssI/VgrG [unclassified Pseudomonas]|uniref:type VI secretion system Vgr family protein n=1 Tax=unclassified Pseudomonas TaxID=196821 RepID=UPI000D3BD6AA|nr:MULTISPECIES: type VI secretion system tip protein TssI/VgrG [unclassified Pseudomonas]RAU39914.1 type VI secretion system tip protein VgrG [Pseudomonas sp. RIT 409]RAU46374.1 type VI secretion system tip protein VgrG [Pseudomonas sp. RIT 412]
MRENSHLTLTLVIADSQQNFHVIGVNGHERLNAPFRFEIDLISPERPLAQASMLHRSAYLSMGNTGDTLHGIHGRVHALTPLYFGQDANLYRLTLMPALQQLDGARHKRTYHGMSVLDILHQVLQRYALLDCNVCFDRMVGTYPPRAQCTQYEENDLHFISRLCEEEGITFRFEHAPHSHALVFSDDPMSFSEWPRAASVDHLSERLSARHCYSSHSGEHYVPPTSALVHDAFADNQALWIAYGEEAGAARCAQTQRRALERLRCERQDIVGRSTQPWLRCGQIMRIEDQPEPRFNDHWLPTEVRHTAWQLNPLRNCRAGDVIQILQAIACHDANPGGVARLLAPAPDDGRPPTEHYENHFQVIPWSMPFRPPLRHPKPRSTGWEKARRLAGPADRTGRIPIRFDWEDEDAPPGGGARVTSELATHHDSACLKVGFFDGDPDQPVICGVYENLPTQQGRHDPRPDLPTPLQFESLNPLRLTGARATVEVHDEEIRYLPHALPTQDAPLDFSDV